MTYTTSYALELLSIYILREDLISLFANKKLSLLIIRLIGKYYVKEGGLIHLSHSYFIITY
jgi:hypothetical protein